MSVGVGRPERFQMGVPKSGFDTTRGGAFGEWVGALPCRRIKSDDSRISKTEHRDNGITDGHRNARICSKFTIVPPRTRDSAY